MRPVFSLNGALVLLPACFAAAACLAYISFATFFTDVSVDALLLGWIGLSFVFATQYVLEFGA